MASNVVPAWIKERKNEAELEKARQEARVQANLAASLLIQRDGPAFWERFVNTLKVNADALPEIGIRGEMSVTGEVEKEACCVVQVVRQGLIPAIKSLNLFYSKRNYGVIRFTQLEGDDFDLALSVVDNNVVVVYDSIPLSPERLADALVKRLVDVVENMYEV